jgi:hypothetical protein
MTANVNPCNTDEFRFSFQQSDKCLCNLPLHMSPLPSECAMKTFLAADVSIHIFLKQVAFSGILRRVALVRTDVSEELSTFIVRVARIGELGTTLTVTSNRSTLVRLTLLLAHRFLLHWRWRRYVPPKPRFLQEPNGLTSQKTPFFSVQINCDSQNITKMIPVVLYNFPPNNFSATYIAPTITILPTWSRGFSLKWKLLAVTCLNLLRQQRSRQ